MKAVILAAGKGTRMLPITAVKPKPMIKVAGKPFLQYLIDRLLKAGYNEMGIVLGYKKEIIENFIKEKGYRIETIEQKNLIGTAEAVRVCRDYVDDENFIVVCGDNLYSPRDLSKLNKKDDYCYIYTHQGEYDEYIGPIEIYGQVIVEDGFVKEIIEKPKKQVSDLINVGLYKFTPEIFDAIKSLKSSEKGELKITDAINILAKDKRVKVLEIKDYWVDMVGPENMYAISEFLVENGGE